MQVECTFSSQFPIICRAWYFICHLRSLWWNSITIILIQFWTSRRLFQGEILCMNFQKEKEIETILCYILTSDTTGTRFCACKAIEALICLAFSIFGNIAEAPHLHFSINLCWVPNTWKESKLAIIIFYLNNQSATQL